MMRIIFYLGVIGLLIACDGNKAKISGEVSSATAGEPIYLEKLEARKTAIIDSVNLKKNGKFSFSVKLNEPRFYRLNNSKGEQITLLVEPGERVRLKIPFDKFQSGYEVEGSLGSLLVQGLSIHLNQTHKKLDSLSVLYQLAENAPDTEMVRDNLEKEYDRVIEEQRKNNISFVLNNYRSIASVYALYQNIDDDLPVFYLNKDLQFFKIVSDTLSSVYPRSQYVRALILDFQNRFNERKARSIQSMIDDAETKIPDIRLPNIDGDSVSLLSLSGKNTLLSFWSFRDRNCLMENLELIDIYKKYQNKNFEIFQVSLDENRQNWKNYISDTGLPWISVNDEQGVSSFAARMYNIQELPSNYLINSEGDIVGKNLWGKELDNKLAELSR